MVSHLWSWVRRLLLRRARFIVSGAISKRIGFLWGAGLIPLAAIILFCLQAPAQTQTAIPVVQAQSLEKPNIVVFMIDDLDQKSMNQLLEIGRLPNIQAHLISRGVTFDNSFATDSICCPSRATFFSGQYVHNHGVKDITEGAGYLYPTDATGQGGEDTLLPKWMKTAGYRTALFGKYLNKYGETDGSPSRIPSGWDQWLALYSNTTYNVYGYDYNENGQLKVGGTAVTDYQTDFISKKVTDYLSSSVVTPTEPQFIYVAVTPPHTTTNENQFLAATSYGGVFSWQIPPAPRYSYLIDGNVANGELPKQNQSTMNTNFNEGSATYSLKPDWMRNNVPMMSSLTLSYAARQYKQRLAAMLSVDDMVGSIAAILQHKGMYKNTIFFLTSDNGYLLGEHRLAEKGVGYEEAIRVPLVISGAGIVPASRCSSLVANHDLAVTIADLSGASPTRNVDGRSLRPWLIDPSKSTSRRQILVEHYQENTKLVALDLIPPYSVLRNLVPNQTNFSFIDYGNISANVSIEYYTLDADPVQLYNTGATLGASLPSFQSTLSSLQTCTGSGCTMAEDSVGQSDKENIKLKL